MSESAQDGRGCACQDFSRSELLRRGVVAAGRGLPAIEPGMPTPAGTGLSRRSFVLASAGLALTVYGAGRLIDPAAFSEGIAAAATVSASQPVLVSVYLQGGIDSMSVLCPTGDPLYTQFRSDLAVAPGGTPFAEDPALAWNPLAAPIQQLYAQGKVSVMPTVGYTDPNQSHFTSRHYWEVGATQADLNTGWLGRYLDVVGTADNPLQGLSLDYALQPSLATARMPVATISSPSAYSFYAPGVWGVQQNMMYDAFDSLGAVGVASGDSGLIQSGQAAQMSNTLRTQLLQFQPAAGASSTPALPAGYPTSSDSFPARMAAIPQMLAAGLPLSCVSVSTDSVFDTHESQAAPFATALGEVSQTLLAFQQDLEARGLDNRVLTLVWSEFGRRPQENASAGTDHGAAGCAFVIGTRAAGTMIGEWLGLSSGLDPLGNLKETADFRSLYSSLLEQWLGHDANGIIPGAAQLPRYTVVK